MPDAHAALRRGTRAEHDRVDAAFGRFNLGDRTDYLRFLRAHERAYLPVEDALATTAVADMVPEWPVHRRGNALRADLRALGSPPGPSFPAPPLATPAEAFGAWYVLEGSRLGGTLLARAVAPGLPTAFLATRGETWAKSVELLNNNLYQPEDLDRALHAARAVFALFERAALEPS